MDDTSMSSLNETVLSTRDTLSVFEQFMPKLQGPYKEKIAALLVSLMKINHNLATYSQETFEKNTPFWKTWFSTLNKIADDIADLLNGNIKHGAKWVERTYDDQIQGLHQRLAQLMDYENSRLRIIIDDDGSIHYIENIVEQAMNTTTINKQTLNTEFDECIEENPISDYMQMHRFREKMTMEVDSLIPTAYIGPSSTAYIRPPSPPAKSSISVSCCLCLPGRSKRKKLLNKPLNLHSKFESRPRLMISYNWDSQVICKKIYDHLRSDGYVVWFDVQNMHGCIYTAMAEAVESAQIILYGMTERYRHSDNCRKELTYACKKRKRMIPLRLEPKYDPDGWLGLISAELLYIDFTKKDFDTNYQQLLNEIHSIKEVL